MPLPDVAHLAQPAHQDVLIGHPGRLQKLPSLGLHLLEGGVGRVPVEPVEAAVEAAGEVEGERGAQKSERRGRPRAQGRDEAGDAQGAGDAVGVHRAGAAEGEEQVLARVLAALDGVHARRVRHVLVDDLVDAPGRLQRVEAEGDRETVFIAFSAAP